MKKEWKAIEGLAFRIDVGSTTAQALSEDVPAPVLCFTTDGEIVLNGVRFYDDFDVRIKQNASDIATNAENIKGLTERVDAAEEDISDNTAKIKQNASDIATNAEDIQGLKERVDVAEEDISDNTARIEQNEKKLKDAIFYRFSTPSYISSDDGATISLTGQYTTLGSGIDRTKEDGGTAYEYGALLFKLPNASTSTNGLMSASDKSTLDNLVEEISQKADNADLSNLKEELSQKVDKVEGKGLSTNDFSNDYVKKVNSYAQMPYINGEPLIFDESQIQNVGILGDGLTSEVSSICYSSSLNKFLVTVGLKKYSTWSGFINVPDKSVYTKDGLANTPLYNTDDHKLYWYDGEKLNQIGDSEVLAAEIEELKKLLKLA